MSSIAERIRRFRSDPPLSKTQRRPPTKEEFWWIDEKLIEQRSRELESKIEMTDEANLKDLSLNSDTAREFALPYPTPYPQQQNLFENSHFGGNADLQPAASSSKGEIFNKYEFLENFNRIASPKEQNQPTENIISNLIRKEEEITSYLDSHLDHLYDRVDNILEEFGIAESKPLKHSEELTLSNALNKVESNDERMLYMSTDEIVEPPQISPLVVENIEMEENCQRDSTNDLPSIKLLQSHSFEKVNGNNMAKSINSTNARASSAFYLSSSFESESSKLKWPVVDGSLQVSVHLTETSLSFSEVEPYLDDFVVKNLWDRFSLLQKQLTREEL